MVFDKTTTRDTTMMNLDFTLTSYRNRRNRTLLGLFSFPFLSPLFHRLFLIRRYCMVNGSKSFQLGSYGLTALQDKVMWDLVDLI